MQLRQLVSSESADSCPSSCDPPVIPSGSAVFARFPHVIGCFLSALARGWPWTLALEAFRNLDQGRFFDDSRVFLADSPLPGRGLASWSCSTFTLASDSATIVLFLSHSRIILVRSSIPLLPTPSRMTLDVPLRKNGKPSRWFPPFIRLARDPSTGLFQLPAARVTAVVERASAWRHYLGPLDGVAQSIIDGNFSYPRASWSYVPSWNVTILLGSRMIVLRSHSALPLRIGFFLVC